MSDQSKLDLLKENLFLLPENMERVVQEALTVRLWEMIQQSKRQNVRDVGTQFQAFFDYLGVDPTRGRDHDALMDALIDVKHLSSAEARSIAAKLTKPKIGRPSSVRQQAVLALELRLYDITKYRWRVVADMLCDCGLVSHKGKAGAACLPKLRLAVIDLKRFLENNGIDPDNPSKAQGGR